MEVLLREVERLILYLRRTLDGDISLEVLDSLQFRAEGLLSSCVLLASSTYMHADAVQAVLPDVQAVVHTLTDISNRLEISNGGYHPGYFMFSGRGRPSLNIEMPMLSYFLDNGFSAVEIASLLHTSLSTIRRRMSLFGLSIRSRYSIISDGELDQLVTDIQHHYPLCGYRMMRGHLVSLGHRVQESRVRASMLRTDPEGVLLRRITAIQRRTYSVASPNSLWHLDGNHRLIR